MLDPRGIVEYQNVLGNRFMVGELETQGEGASLARIHRRAVAVSQSPKLDGRVVYYSDSYAQSGLPTSYLYAKHSKNTADFFETFDRFFIMATEEFRELRGTSFPFIANMGGQFHQQECSFPFAEKFIDRY